MNTVKKIAKNASALFAVQFVSAILSLILSVLIARELGTAIFGKYSFAIAFTAIFAVFADFGYNTLLIRDVARDKSKANNYVNNIMGIRAFFSLTIFVIIIIVINIMNYPDDTKSAVYLFGTYTLLTSFAVVFKVTFRAFEKMEYEALTTILSTLIRVFLGILALLLGYGLIELGAIFIVAGIVDVIFSFLVCRKRFVRPRIKFDLNYLKATIKIALPLGMLSIFGLIYMRIDTVMLSIMKGDSAVGWYNAAYNLILGFKPIPLIFLNAILPLMAGYFVYSMDSLKRAFEKATKFLLLIGIPLAVGITLTAHRLIPILYGSQFNQSIIVLQILAWDLSLMFLYGPLGNVLVSIDRQNQMAVIAGMSALLNVILNLFLIPPYSYVGAAVATIITEIFLFTGYLLLVTKHLKFFFLHKLIARPAIASAAMGFFIYLSAPVNLILVIIISISIYFTILYLIGGFSKEDINLIRQIFRGTIGGKKLNE